MQGATLTYTLWIALTLVGVTLLGILSLFDTSIERIVEGRRSHLRVNGQALLAWGLGALGLLTAALVAARMLQLH